MVRIGCNAPKMAASLAGLRAVESGLEHYDPSAYTFSVARLAFLGLRTRAATLNRHVAPIGAHLFPLPRALPNGPKAMMAPPDVRQDAAVPSTGKLQQLLARRRIDDAWVEFTSLRDAGVVPSAAQCESLIAGEIWVRLWKG